MTVIFFSKALKLDADYRSLAKICEKVLCFLYNRI